MASRLKTLSRGSQAMLVGGAGTYADSVRGELGAFFQNPSAKNYRALEAALLEYQEAFQKYEDKPLEQYVAEQREERE